jgi:mitogen-activated protein kinase kinase 1
VARQVLTGLSHLHKALRVVHRDIKPSNLLLNSAGQLKLTDFGVSGQLSNSMSKCLSWVGTVTYMSPERIRGDTYSYNTDVWSLGLLLLECATGRFPYPPQQADRDAPGGGGGGGAAAAAAAAAGAGLGFWELLEYIGERGAAVGLEGATVQVAAVLCCCILWECVGCWRRRQLWKAERHAGSVALPSRPCALF